MKSGAVERDGAHRSRNVKCHHRKRPTFVSIICQFNPAHRLHSMTYIRILHSTVFNQSPFTRLSQQNVHTQITLLVSRKNRRQNQAPQFKAVKIKFEAWTLTLIKGLITDLFNGNTATICVISEERADIRLQKKTNNAAVSYSHHTFVFRSINKRNIIHDSWHQ